MLRKNRRLLIILILPSFSKNQIHDDYYNSPEKHNTFKRSCSIYKMRQNFKKTIQHWCGGQLMSCMRKTKIDKHIAEITQSIVKVDLLWLSLKNCQYFICRIKGVSTYSQKSKSEDQDQENYSADCLSLVAKC